MAEAISHPLIALIRERGLLDALQIEEIGQEVQRSGKSVIQILQDYGLLDLDSILQIMADHLGTMVVTLEPDTIPPEAIAAVPNETARMYQVVPMALYGDTLQIALADPLNPQTMDELGFSLKYTLQVVVANPVEVAACIEKFYPAQADLGYTSLLKELWVDVEATKEEEGPKGLSISLDDAVNDVPPAPRSIQGVSVVAAVAQGARTIEIGMAYRFGATGPIGPVSKAGSYTLTALQTLQFTAPSLSSGAMPYYRVYFWRCPDLDWTDWRLIYDNAHSQCPPNGGVTLQPVLSLTRLEGDSIGLTDQRWQPNHLVQLYPPPDTDYTMMATVEERWWEEYWELGQKIPGSAEAAEVGLNNAIAELYSAFGMIQEAQVYASKATQLVNTALGQARPRAGDQPMRMGGVALWR